MIFKDFFGRSGEGGGMSLIGRLFCRAFGHTAPNLIGECDRCEADLLGLPIGEKMAIVAHAHRIAMRQIIQYGGRGSS